MARPGRRRPPQPLREMPPPSSARTGEKRAGRGAGRGERRGEKAAEVAVATPASRRAGSSPPAYQQVPAAPEAARPARAPLAQRGPGGPPGRARPPSAGPLCK